MEGNGVGQVLPGDQAVDEGLSRGLIERVDDAEKTGEKQHMPILNIVEVYRKPVDKGLNHAQGLRENQQAAAVEAVRDDSADSA